MFCYFHIVLKHAVPGVPDLARPHVPARVPRPQGQLRRPQVPRLQCAITPQLPGQGSSTLQGQEPARWEELHNMFNSKKVFLIVFKNFKCPLL